jgi:hypothetical protein
MVEQLTACLRDYGRVTNSERLLSRQLPMLEDVPKRQHGDPTVQLPADFESVVKDLLKTPPPPPRPSGHTK